MPHLLNQEVIARGSTVYGQTVVVTKDHYDGGFENASDTLVSVTVQSVPGHDGIVAGFTNIRDAQRFLHSVGRERFGEEERDGLGVPRGMMTEMSVAVNVDNDPNAPQNRETADSVDYAINAEPSEIGTAKKEPTKKG